MEQAQLEALRATLAEELAAIDRQLNDYGIDPVADTGFAVEVDEGFADAGQATAERAEALGLAEQLKGRRAEIVAALARIDEGSYGKCERCGQEIPFERLEVRPTATLCVSCKQALDS